MTPMAFLTFAKAVGDPTRLSMLVALDEGDLTVGELAAAMGVTSAAVSYHVRQMRHAGLVSVRRRGRCTLIQRLDQAWATVASILARPTWEQR